MGKIYNDVEKVNNPEVNDIIENIVSIGSLVDTIVFKELSIIFLNHVAGLSR